MRIVFAGTGTFGLPTLRALVEGGQEIALMITQPDRPSGRGQGVKIGPIKWFAREQGITVIQPESINEPDTVARLRAIAPDLLLVIAYGQKVGPHILEIPHWRAVNLHASLLPRYRGAAPMNWAIINGETETGLSVIDMVDQIDAGDILGQRATTIDPAETAGDLHERLSQLGARVVSEVVRELPLEEVERRRQNENQVTWAPRLTKADGLIDWAKPAGQVFNHIRGVTPWPSAYTYLAMKGRKPSLRLVIDRAVPGLAGGAKGEPGTIIAAADDGIEVATARGTVRIIHLTPAGKRAMTAADFSHGHSLAPGMRLSSEQGK